MRDRNMATKYITRTTPKRLKYKRIDRDWIIERHRGSRGAVEVAMDVRVGVSFEGPNNFRMDEVPENHAPHQHQPQEVIPDDHLTPTMFIQNLGILLYTYTVML